MAFSQYNKLFLDYPSSKAFIILGDSLLKYVVTMLAVIPLSISCYHFEVVTSYN
jgi:hypothetical protein